ncbi:MAG TPA: hypothetical protein VK749_13645 [Xanthobacteraceae bacterium]|nr:hypothetical protein [Xanthobacteraceae bacterium]
MATALARLASPNLLEAFSKIEFAVLNTRLCNASAAAEGEGFSIILHGGLVKTMIFHLELAEICYRMGQVLGAKISPGETSTETGNALSVVAYASSCAMDHFAASGAPFPRLGKCLPIESKERVLTSFVRAIWFILVHEVGHVQLGHHRRGETAVPCRPTLAVAETINDFKAQEFEADSYVVDTLSAPERAFAVEYLLSPLDMFSVLELRLRNTNDTHPMAINRLSHMIDRVSSFADTGKLSLARETLQGLASRARTSRKVSTERVTQHAAIQAIATLVYLYVRALGPAITAPKGSHAELWDEIASHWFAEDVRNYSLLR